MRGEARGQACPLFIAPFFLPEKVRYEDYSFWLENIVDVRIVLSAYPHMQSNVKEICFAYSEEIRLRIGLLVRNSEVCVNCLVAVLHLPQSTISRHLGILRRANVIKANRKGTNTYYSANRDKTETGRLNKDLLNIYRKHLAAQEPFQTDHINLLAQKDVCTVECKIA